MGKKDEELKVTSNIKYAFQKFYAIGDLKREYIRQDKHEYAKRCAIDQQVSLDKAWELVFEIYPHIEGKSYSYDRAKNEIISGVYRKE